MLKYKLLDFLKEESGAIKLYFHVLIRINVLGKKIQHHNLNNIWSFDTACYVMQILIYTIQKILLAN